MNLIPDSLRGQIILAGSIICSVTLLAAGMVLNYAFRHHVEARFDESLRLTMHDLVASAQQQTDSGLKLRWRPSNPVFNSPLSGWYWIIHSHDGKPVATSDSLLNEPATWLIQKDLQQPLNRMQYLNGPADKPLRSHVRTIRFGESGSSFVFVVAGPQDDVEKDVRAFGYLLMSMLGIVALGLATILLLQARISLRPLKRARMEIARIRAGAATTLDATYPLELRPLAEEINALITDNQTIISRARLQASNLAHALKNPLSVIRNEQQGPEGVRIRNQVDKLSAIIKRYLSRVRIAGALQSHDATTLLSATLEDIVYSLKQIHRDKQIQFETHCDNTLVVKVEVQDLEEILGNLLKTRARFLFHFK